MTPTTSETTTLKPNKELLLEALALANEFPELCEKFETASANFKNIPFIFQTILYIPVGFLMERHYLNQMELVNARLDVIDARMKFLNDKLKEYAKSTN